MLKENYLNKLCLVFPAYQTPNIKSIKNIGNKTNKIKLIISSKKYIVFTPKSYSGVQRLN